MLCPSCEAKVDPTSDVCPKCGADMSEVLTTLVSKASAPSLASLIQRGKDRGLITPRQDYTNGSTSA
jgi:predicted amidophosphoribosyltransferase